MTTPSPAIGAFWRAFSDAQASLQALPLRERVGAANALIDQHLEGLALEMSGDDADAVVDLIVTAHGSIERFPLVAQVVAAAPALPHYRVRAFRERTTQPDFPIGMEGFELSTSEVLVALEQDGGQAALEIRFGREIPSDYQDHARNMAFIMLDHVLGEYDFAVKVGAVDFVGEPDDAHTPWVPLSQLPPVFDRYWTEILGHTGHFPTGEAEWDGLELQFDCPIDEDGNELPPDDIDSEDAPETGVVMVNTSANAVAMRADLAYALTVDLAVPDSDTLTAVQDLQDQAATVLQVPQLGILVLTLMRAGRRQALYYVSDEQLAARLQAAGRQQPQPELHLRGDRDVRYERVAQAMAAAQQAGLSKIGFVTEPPQRTP